MTNPTAMFSRPDAEQEQATLADVMRIAEKIADLSTSSMGWSRGSLVLANLAGSMRDALQSTDLDGLVHDGEVYNATVRQMWGACRCADGKCAITPTDADFWRPTKRDAEDRVARMVERRGRWEKDGPMPHLVTQLVARTSVEVVR